MPVRRGKKVVDTRPQAVEGGVGSVPFTSPRTEQRGACRVAVSGVEGISSADMSSTVAAAPHHFRIPTAVLQRIQQQHTRPAPTIVASETSNAPLHSEGAQQQTDSTTSSIKPVPVAPVDDDAHHRRLSSHAGASTRADTEASHKTQSVTTPKTPINADELAIEEVSEADIAATVAARKAVSSFYVGRGATTITNTVAPAQTPLSASDIVQENDETGSEAVKATKASSQTKPIIFSHRWRRQLFARADSAHPSLLLALWKEKRIDTHENDDNRSDREADEEAEEDGDADNDDAFSSPFGNASVIKFRKSEDETRPFCGPRSANGERSSGSSSNERSSGSDSETAVMDLKDDKRGAEQRTRRERHAQSQQALEVREKKRVQRHMAGFDKEFLRRQEAQLLQESEEGETEEDDNKDESVSIASPVDTSAEDGEVDGTDDGSDAGFHEESEETATLSFSQGSAASTAVEEHKIVNDVPSSSSSVSSRREGQGGGAGFGAMKRARQLEAEERQRLRNRSDAHKGKCVSSPLLYKTDDTSPACVSSAPSPYTSMSGLTSAQGAMARSHWLDFFFFAVHENRLHHGGCHHTLIGLRGPVAIHGPCGLIGFGLGEVCVNGFYLGKKQINLWHEAHRAVLLPMRKLKTKHARDMELPRWTHVPDPVWPPPAGPMSSPTPPTTTEMGLHEGSRAVFSSMNIDKARSVLGQPLSASQYSTESANSGATHSNDNHSNEEEWGDGEEGFLQSLQWNCEAVFGEVDWEWVEATVQHWRGLYSNKLPPILLVLQPSSSVARPRRVAGPMRKFYFSRKRNRSQQRYRTSDAVHRGAQGDAYMDIPSFVAHRSEASVDLALLPSIVPSVAAQGCGCVMVLGSANIGKSTLCRFLTNVLLSQHGLCYWLDLDVGQPEFGVPGQLTLVLVRRPLLRERDSSCVRVVTSLFIGANTAVRCPVSTANALATICAQTAAVARHHPVVVNTHGWVLQTGRRVSVEALRRLRPRQVIHLHKTTEDAWTRDTAALLDPRNGLNADVVQRRFLIRHFKTTTTTAADSSEAERFVSGKTKTLRKNKHARHPSASVASPPVATSSLLCRLPFPHALDVPHVVASSNPASPVSSPNSPNTTDNNKNTTKRNAKEATTPSHTWRGQVHAVRVAREETYSTLQLVKATKGTRGRQQRWQTYFAPLLHFYAQRNAGVEERQQAEAETTLLEAPLSSLGSIVLAERDEKAGDAHLFPSDTNPTSAGLAEEVRQMRAEVAAALEHAVVAVLFHRPSDVLTSSSCSAFPASPLSHTGCVVRSLASLSCGFPVTCYGIIESSEQELLRGEGTPTAAAGRDGGWIRLRVPLRPAVVAAMLRASDATPAVGTPSAQKSDAGALEATLGATKISIAYSAELRLDTAFVDV